MYLTDATPKAAPNVSKEGGRKSLEGHCTRTRRWNRKEPWLDGWGLESRAATCGNATRRQPTLPTVEARRVVLPRTFEE